MAYDFLIVGAGLFGSVFAREATNLGYRCLVIDKRRHIGGNCYTEKIADIDVHKYGPHIFHTSSKKIWDYINQFSTFENFELNVVANYKSKLYALPFNMWTFNQLWGINTRGEAIQKINSQRFKGEPKNLEEYALSTVGRDVYEKLIYGYTKKQWKTEPSQLPTSIIRRIPLRFTFNNNYFNDSYQGIPENGYTEIFTKLLEGSDISLGVDYFKNKDGYDKKAKRVVYTGPIDKFYEYKFGKLDYRALRFEENVVDSLSVQGCPVMNYTDENVEHTRVTEHKFFKRNCQTTESVITKEFPVKLTEYASPAYPINNKENQSRYVRYKALNTNPKYIFGGRLAEYKYYDMHQVIGSALAAAKAFLV